MCRRGADPARRAALGRSGAELIETETTETGELDMADALRRLAERGLTRVLCEGGGRIAASLLRARLADEVAWFSAGAAIGADGVPAVSGMGVAGLDAAPRLRLIDSETLDGDALTRWAPP
jgi:diaminohydroxyphosphoribosylaminopyrimidine deaminase/5-amino-6-(5-phosphoribosylamino)uracil reductase